MSKEILYQERVKRFVTTANHQEPDRVPVLSLVETFAISYANSSINECLESHEKEFEVYAKPYEDIYFDGASTFGMNRAMKVQSALGSNAYFISRDGTTLQHEEMCPMNVEEYDEFIKNPIKYTDNVLFKRKYPNLNKPYPQNKEVLKAAAFEAANFGKKMADGAIYLKEKLGIPVTTNNASIVPLDLIFDFYRGFIPTITDLRRIPDKVKEATEVLGDFSLGIATGGAAQLSPFPWIFTPLHIPTFLGPKKFAEFYWPSYKKMLMAIHERGGKVCAYLEGHWENYYEYLQELPKSFLIALIEGDDIIEAKKKIGDTITLAGGMSLDKLKCGSKQECIDYAKNIVDHCAPGGGFIFTTNMSLLSGGDVNPENLQAVNEFVHEYGLYK